MEVFFDSLTAALLLSAFLTFFLLVRQAVPLLESEDQMALRSYWKTPEGLATWRKRDRAVKRAWKEHARRFPRSQKRLLFAALLIAAAVSTTFYPLWRFVGGK